MARLAGTPLALRCGGSRKETGFHGFESSRFGRSRGRLYRGRRRRRIPGDQAERHKHGGPGSGSGFRRAEPEAGPGNRSLSEPGCNAGVRGKRRCASARAKPSSGDERSSHQAAGIGVAESTDADAEAGGRRFTPDRTTDIGSVMAERVDFTGAFIISSISSRQPGIANPSLRRSHARSPSRPRTACQNLR